MSFPCCCGAPGCTVGSDDFSATNDPPSGWTEVTGTHWETNGGVLRTDENNKRLTFDTPHPDTIASCKITIKVKVGSGGGVLVMVNWTDANNYHYASYANEGSDLGCIELHEVLAGADTTLRRFRVTFLDGQFNQFIVYFGELTFAAFDNNNAGGWVEVSAGTGDKVGVGSLNAVGGYVEFDDFVFEKLKRAGDAGTATCPAYVPDCSWYLGGQFGQPAGNTDTGCVWDGGTISGSECVLTAANTKINYDGLQPTSSLNIYAFFTASGANPGDELRFYINNDTYAEYCWRYSGASPPDNYNSTMKLFINGAQSGQTLMFEDLPGNFKWGTQMWITHDGAYVMANTQKNTGRYISFGAGSPSDLAPAFGCGTNTSGAILFSAPLFGIHKVDDSRCQDIGGGCTFLTDLRTTPEHFKLTFHSAAASTTGARCENGNACTDLNGVEHVVTWGVPASAFASGCQWAGYFEWGTGCVPHGGVTPLPWYSLTLGVRFSGGHYYADVFIQSAFNSAIGQVTVDLGTSPPDLATLNVTSGAMTNGNGLCDFSGATVDIEAI